jgi:hypothetical protein
MADAILKILNLVIVILVWVGVWGFMNTLMDFFNMNLPQQLVTYSTITVLAFLLLYHVNNGFTLKTTIYL